jgi:hypothetical protein
MQNNVMYPRFDPDHTVYNIVDNELTIKPNLLALPNFNKSFDDIMDTRAADLLEFAKDFEHIYLFWSGGIDSTTILCSLIKNWSTADLSKVIVVCNQFCVDEYPLMYYRYVLGKFKTVPTDDFWSGKLAINNENVYVTGDIGDTVMGYCNLDSFDNMFPNAYKKSYKDQTDNLITFFTAPHGRRDLAEFAFNHIVDSMNANNIQVDTVFDFLWWVDFNWGYDVDIYYILTTFGLVKDTVDIKKFYQKNFFIFYAGMEFQLWSIATVGTDLKIRDSISSNKFAQKKYILDLTNDLDYFTHKHREGSVSKNSAVTSIKYLIGVDPNYNIYYRDPVNYYAK